MTVEVLNGQRVYRSSRRRFFTLDAACRDEARLLIQKRCEKRGCEFRGTPYWSPDGHDYSSAVCELHSDPLLMDRLVTRVARMIRRKATP